MQRVYMRAELVLKAVKKGWTSTVRPNMCMGVFKFRLKTA